MSISFNGFNKNVLTFKGTDLKKGVIVSPSGNDEVITTPIDGNFIGVVDSFRGNLAGVQLTGYVEIKYIGTAPTVGFVKLVGATGGTVKVSTSTTETTAQEYKVIKVDSTNKLVGILL